MNSPQVIGIIPARYGSTRFPGKPLINIGGKSMIQWTYESSSRCKSLHQVIVATDDDRIMKEVQSFGGKAILTSTDHLTGTDRLIEVVEHLRKHDGSIQLERDIVVNIQGDEPGIESELIHGVVALKIQHPDWVITTAAVPMNSKEAKDPNRVKVIFTRSGRALYFSRSIIPCPFKEDSKFLREPNSKSTKESLYYRHLGIYCYNMDFLLDYNQLPESSWESVESLEQLRVIQNGFDIGVYVAEEASLSIDHPEDVRIVEDDFRRRGWI